MADSFFAKLRALAGVLAPDGRPPATDITIADVGTYFTGTTVEAALQELGVGGAGAAIEALDEGISLTVALTGLDFVGAGVTATETGDVVTVTVPGGSSSPIEILDEGVSVTATPVSLDFVGTGVTATETADAVTVTITSGADGADGVDGAGYAATSTTSLAIGTGSKVFTTQAGLAYLAGTRARASSAANTANFMEGVVTSYSGTTFTLGVDLVGGSGTLADWNLSVAGQQGATGAAGAGSTVLIEDEGTPLATAADTLDFVGAGVTVTGTGTTKTVTIPGGGGGGGSPLDTPPGSPHALDDEFPGPSLDAKWDDPTTSASGQTNDIGFAADGWVSLAPDTADKHVFGVRQDAPAGDFSVAAKFIELGGGNDVRSGIFVGIDGGLGHVLGPFLQDAQVSAIGVTTVSNTADWSGFDGFLQNYGGDWSLITWVRIRWDATATTLYFDMSQNGVVWRNVGSRSGMSQPDQLGFCIYSNSGAIQTAEKIMLDWFRVTTSAAF